MKLYIKSNSDILPSKAEIRELKSGLIDFFDETRDKTPKDTIDLLVDCYGIDAAKWIIAIMVNAKGRFDRRISERVYDWAEPLAPDEDTLMKNGIYYCDEIHPVHMNQLAEEIMSR